MVKVQNFSKCCVLFILLSTKLSADEIRKLHKQFLADYPSGRMNIDQTKHMYGQMFNGRCADKFAAQVFRVYDLGD
jgi:Ca2+-binding EF-hand superfamily protein